MFFHSPGGYHTVASQGPHLPVPLQLIDGPVGFQQPGRQVTRVSGLTKCVSVLTCAASTLYVFTLPLLSRVFNDSTWFGMPGWKKLCWTPAEFIECGDGSNYTLLAMQHNRHYDGMYIGCSCGEGVFGDWLCKVQSPYEIDVKGNPFIPYSISYFISTPSGTGGMAALTSWPIMSMWLAGIDNNGVLSQINPGLDPCSGLSSLLWWTQMIFHLCYGAFLFCSSCIFDEAHGFFVACFIISMVVHYSVLACKVGCSTLTGRLITILCAVGVASVVSGAVISLVLMRLVNPALFVGQYAFWFGECVGLTCGMSMGTILLILEH